MSSAAPLRQAWPCPEQNPNSEMFDLQPGFSPATDGYRCHDPGSQRNRQRGFIVGSSPAIQRVLSLVDMVAPTDSTVLIEGETGTGKELIARAIHEQSRRSTRPFITVNCAAIPAGLLESELFGHEKGAFTGAAMRRPGRFKLADQGSLFLDEIGEMPVELQAKLLRVLQEGEFEMLGSNVTQKVNVRLIAATNANLRDMVSDRQFRDDLYYRINVFPITVPALRERPEDIPLLVRHFVAMFADKIGKQIDDIPSRVMQGLVEHPWPGNVRELQNLLERSTILSSGGRLDVPLSTSTRKVQAWPRQTPVTLADAKREHILRTLEQTRGAIAGPNGAAALLGVKRSTLYFLMRKLGIPTKTDVCRDDSELTSGAVA